NDRPLDLPATDGQRPSPARTALRQRQQKRVRYRAPAIRHALRSERRDRVQRSEQKRNRGGRLLRRVPLPPVCSFVRLGNASVQITFASYRSLCTSSATSATRTHTRSMATCSRWTMRTFGSGDTPRSRCEIVSSGRFFAFIKAGSEA